MGASHMELSTSVRTLSMLRSKLRALATKLSTLLCKPDENTLYSSVNETRYQNQVT